MLAMQDLKNFKFLITNDLSPKIAIFLSPKHNIDHARVFLLHMISHEKQVAFCLQNNYIMVTQSKRHFYWCQKMNCEAIFMNAPTAKAVAEALRLHIKKAKIMHILSG